MTDHPDMVTISRAELDRLIRENDQARAKLKEAQDFIISLNRDNAELRSRLRIQKRKWEVSGS